MLAHDLCIVRITWPFQVNQCYTSHERHTINSVKCHAVGSQEIRPKGSLVHECQHNMILQGQSRSGSQNSISELFLIQKPYCQLHFFWSFSHTSLGVLTSLQGILPATTQSYIWLRNQSDINLSWFGMRRWFLDPAFWNSITRLEFCLLQDVGRLNFIDGVVLNYSTFSGNLYSVHVVHSFSYYWNTETTPSPSNIISVPNEKLLLFFFSIPKRFLTIKVLIYLFRFLSCRPCKRAQGGLQ